MALIQLRDVRIGFSGPPLLNQANLTIDPGERVCLVGRNGEGKTTLLRILDGTVEPDDGEVIRSQGLTVALLPQQVPRGLDGSIDAIVAEGLGAIGPTLVRHRHIVERLDAGPLDDGERDRLEAELHRLAVELESVEAWRHRAAIDDTLQKLGLDPELSVDTLSAGMKRRVLLARALVAAPDLLILDEPTNHLDIPSIDRLETLFEKYRGTLLFVTHDRVFLRKLSTRILDLDRGVLRSYACDYDTYRQRKEADLAAEEEQNVQFDKKLAQEEVWIRTGIQARRTRNEGRVRALKALRNTRRERRDRIGTARMLVQEAERSGRLVVEAEGISFDYGARPIVRDFSALITRGDKIGIVGPNGAGKTTLLRLLLGDLPPDSGSIRQGVRLEVAYFDQLHAQLDLEASVVENVAEGSDHVVLGGKKKHIYGYLADFLFSPQRARSPVKQLSGGERNRLLLARLFSKPANVLVLDEPTNDLDAETLELLEQLLVDFRGTVLMVSHDREFLNNVVTDLFVLEGDGVVRSSVGGYDDWIAARRIEVETPRPPEAKKPAPAKAKSSSASGRRRLTYGEKLELDALPEQIEELERRQAELHAVMGDPSFYQQDRSRIAETTQSLQSLESELAAAYDRWETLESRDA